MCIRWYTWWLALLTNGQRGGEGFGFLSPRKMKCIFFIALVEYLDAILLGKARTTFNKRVLVFGTNIGG